MPTIGELWVNIGADTSDFERDTQKMNQQLKGISNDMKGVASGLGVSANEMRSNWQHMSDSMKEAYTEAKKKLEPFKKQLQEVKYEFHQMAQGMNEYKGSNQSFMNGLEKLGKKQKKITDEMVKNNDMLKTGFITGVATMLARSTQSEKITANFDRMKNPLYQVNNGLLAITNNMEKMAARGAPAALALSMLGPTANMKELNDMVMLINQGLMRHQMVTIAAAIASVLLYGSLHKAAKDSIPEYAEAWKTMGATMREAFQPMVEVFGMVMTKVYEFITAIGKMMIQFNEAHPLLAKMIQGFVMLLPALFLLLAPLAIGIGLMNGMKAAFYATWMMIRPLVIGLATMSGTVLIVAAAIVIVSVALWALWTKTDWFRGAVIGAWEEVKKATVAAWNYIYNNGIKSTIEAIQTFISVKLLQIQTFWWEHGETIKKIMSVAFALLKGIFETAMIAITTVWKVGWTLMSAIIKGAWIVISTAIEVAVNLIGGIIRAFLKLLQGDWKGALGILKDTLVNHFEIMIDFIKGLGSTFWNAGKGLIEQMGEGIKSAASKVIETVKEVAGKIRDFLPFSPAKTGPLSDLDKLDFGGPISDSLYSAIPKVKGLLTDLVTMPSINANGIGGVAAVGGGDTYNLSIELNPSDLAEMQTVYDFFNTIKQVKRARG